MFANPPHYDISTEGQARVVSRPHEGRPTLFVTVQFTIRHADGRLATDVAKEEIVVEEDGQRVTALDIHRPRATDPLTVMLVLDTSGSMEQDRKLAEAQQAALLFLDMLGGESACGLILFDHQLRVVEPAAAREARDRLREHIRAARASGGTAYLDATRRAIELLGGVAGRKAVLVLTDGIDLNSQARLEEVIRLAESAGVPVYAVGVGPPGKQEPVNTVLVLDKSGSMSEPAGAGAAMTKMAALQRAAGRFVNVMRPGARVALLPFSTTAEPATSFLTEKSTLQTAIGRLEPDGETAFLDAIHDALETLQAERSPSPLPLSPGGRGVGVRGSRLNGMAGKRAIVALTDGIDNSSRRRIDEVIDRARQTQTPLYLLGFGRPGELDEEVLRRLAQASGGSYYHAQSEENLVEIFEKLSIQLHDEGFDQPSLQRLAERTGGKFLHARQPAELTRHYRALAEELQSTYTVTFPSGRQTHDGTARGIDISVVRDGVPLSGQARLDYQVHGVVVPRMDPAIYLLILAVLLMLLALPGVVRRIWKRSTSAPSMN